MKRLIDFFRSVTPRRWVIYLTGIVILACGITMSSKTNLGTSPVISVAYNISDLTGIPFGVMTFIYYVFLIAVQVLLLRREFDPVQCFQLLASFLTSTFIGLFDRFLPSSEVFPVQVLLLILAIVLTGIGIILTVGAQFVPNPADGLASAISRRTGSNPLSTIASGVSSTMISMPVAASKARMLRPSRPMMRRSCSNTEKRHQIIWCRFVIGLHIDRIAVSGNSLKRTPRRPGRFSFDIRDPA